VTRVETPDGESWNV